MFSRRNFSKGLQIVVSQTIQRICGIHCVSDEECADKGTNQNPFMINEERELMIGKESPEL